MNEEIPTDVLLELDLHLRHFEEQQEAIFADRALSRDANGDEPIADEAYERLRGTGWEGPRPTAREFCESLETRFRVLHDWVIAERKRRGV
jgi:hypothetical protein